MTKIFETEGLDEIFKMYDELKSLSNYLNNHFRDKAMRFRLRTFVRPLKSIQGKRGKIELTIVLYAEVDLEHALKRNFTDIVIETADNIETVDIVKVKCIMDISDYLASLLMRESELNIMKEMSKITRHQKDSADGARRVLNRLSGIISINPNLTLLR